MSIFDRVKGKYIARLDELIQAGKEIPINEHSRVVSNSSITGVKKYQHYKLASWAEFVEWRTSCIVILDQIVPKSNLLRNTVNEFPYLTNEPSKLDFSISFLKSVKNELQNGFLDDLTHQIESEVLVDYLAQATSILNCVKNEPSHIAAAVIAGVSLEKILRTLCTGLVPPEPIFNENNAPLGMNALIDLLKKRQVFNEIQAKQLRAWTAIRNSAAHGNFEEFNRHQVEMMLDGVTAFINEHIK